ncbi:MAG: phosphatidate cytidylyltransferase [Flavobacteriaceae bacterium]|nr:phosphatidate cytidylyltransferase [Flavobacteriaceae bacterium]|tara:strand:+ start:56271 stop:57074 length:804 start_codon:yes stop_codon:yes gene_type:complete
MKEIIVRSLSGALYISLIIVTMFTSREWFMGLFLVLGLLTLREFLRLVHLRSYIAYPLFFLFLFFLSYNIFDRNAVYLYLILACFVNLFLLKDLLVVSSIPMFGKKKYISLIFYLIAGFVFLTLIPFRKGQFVPLIVIGVFILVWANDTFAYVIGKSFGKHKLLERISPKKTIEGFLGGLAGAILASFFIFKYIEYFSWSVWIALAVLVSFTGTVGDLIQSKFKRQAGVKDSGLILPGHGGIYDRLDSMVFASPFVFAFLELYEYVS